MDGFSISPFSKALMLFTPCVILYIPNILFASTKNLDVPHLLSTAA
jgi:hypothetical protein